MADARVREGSRNANEGRVSGLTTKGGTTTDYESYLRFDVSGLSGDVVSATFEYGSTFTLTAGLMTLLLVLDCHDIARGAKR